MPIHSRYLFTAAMDVEPGKDALFNEVYDQEHVPHLRRVPGVISVTRAVLDTLRITMCGETKNADTQGVPRYVCILELETPDVLTSTEWAKAVDAGRWPTQVRPFTRNRRHTLHKVLRSE